MGRTVTELVSGEVRPSDPRRFMIEVMLGVMHADGIADDREVATIERELAEHPMFHGLGDAAAMLVDLAAQAIRDAGSPARRAPAIAKGLPARIHRLTAYGLGAEVALADGELAPAERELLATFGRALRIDADEASELLTAARAGAMTSYLDARYRWMRGLVSIACELVVLRALWRGTARSEAAPSIAAFLGALADLQHTPEQLGPELAAASARWRRPDNLGGDLAGLAARLTVPSDRYWMMIYALAAEMPAMVPSWRLNPFIAQLQIALELDDATMANAVTDALAFPAAMPRPE